jgi:hypothetical protein
MQSCYVGWPNLCLATVGTVPRQFSFYLDLLLISPAKTLMQAVHRTFPNIFTVVFFLLKVWYWLGGRKTRAGCVRIQYTSSCPRVLPRI